MFAPEHPVRMAPVFRAIRAPRRGLMPHNSLMYNRTISFRTSSSKYVVVNDELVQACVEAIQANGLFNELHIEGDIDIRIIETAFADPGLEHLVYHTRAYWPLESRERLRDSFAQLHELATLDVSIDMYSMRNVDWDCVISEILSRSQCLQKLVLSLYISQFPKIRAALMNLSDLEYLETLNCVFDFQAEDLRTLTLHSVDASDVLGLIRLGKCDKLESLSIRHVSKRVSGLISEIASMINRSSVLDTLELRDDVWRDDDNISDGKELANAIRASTSLGLVKICTSMFTADAVDLIRTACEEAEVDFYLHDD
jgi:hypothetical protein